MSPLESPSRQLASIWMMDSDASIIITHLLTEISQNCSRVDFVFEARPPCGAASKVKNSEFDFFLKK